MQTFEVQGPVRVSVGCPAGEVEVATVGGLVAEVEVRGLRDDDATREAVADTLVELRAGRDLVVEVPRRGGTFFGREPRVRVEVRVPDDSSLAFRTSSADVEAAGRFAAVEGKTASGDVRVVEAGSVRIESASGDVRVDDVGGAALVKSSSGDVTIGRVAGPVEAAVVSGDLRIRHAERGGTLNAVSGDVEVAALGAGDVDVRTVSGDVSLGVLPGARVHVDVTTVSGDLRSDVELDAAADPGGDGPLVDIRGRTVSGDLRIRRAAFAQNAH